jgi:membrane protein implicated in regulation of membrane protease activity
MKNYKPLRIALFYYEIFRFITFAIHGNAVFTTMQGWQWTAPNALFPLMALFLLIDLDRYVEFLPLSVAGKSVAVVLTIWSVISNMIPSSAEPYSFDAAIVVIAIGDVFSVLVYTRIMKGVKKQGEKPKESENEDNPRS